MLAAASPMEVSEAIDAGQAFAVSVIALTFLLDRDGIGLVSPQSRLCHFTRIRAFGAEKPGTR